MMRKRKPESVRASATLLLVILCFLTGCSAPAQASLGILVSLVAIIILIAAVRALRRSAERRAAIREERLLQAPAAYRQGRDELVTWLPQCRAIVLDQGSEAGAGKDGSDSLRAQHKSERLIQSALAQATLLHSHDITLTSFTAMKELRRLKQCCGDACTRLNKGCEGRPKCLALVESEEVDVDLRFELLEAQGEH